MPECPPMDTIAPSTRRGVLAETGLLNLHPEDVDDPLFRAHPEFFDPHDLVQVRYEALRAHLVDDDKIATLCARYGICRQTYYNLLEKFLASGTAGLLPEKRGPRDAWKLGPDVRSHVRELVRQEPKISGASLASRLRARFGFSVHKRTVEKLLVRVRSKKKNQP